MQIQISKMQVRTKQKHGRIINQSIKFVYRLRCAKNEQIVQLTVICVQGSHDQIESTQYVKNNFTN